MKVSKSRSPDGRPLYRLETDLPVVIPGDIHIPFHDPVALNTFIRATAGGILLIIGDLFDNYALSDFPKEQSKLSKYSLKREIDVAESWIKKFDDNYEDVVYLPGNHEARWDRLVKKNPALNGLEWWWPMRNIIPSGWEMLDVDSRVTLRRNGQLYSIEHGDRASRNSTYVSADKLTALYPNQTTVIGHNHRLAAHHRTHWINSKPVESHAYSVGHISDIGKLGYVSAPDWQKGGAMIGYDGIQLCQLKGEKILWL